MTHIPMTVDSSSQFVAVFAPSFPPFFLGGGPARTLVALVREAPIRFRMDVLTPDRDHGGESRLNVPSNSWTQTERAHIYYVSANKWGRLARGYVTVRQRRPDILYFNSFFNLRMSIIPQILAKLWFWGTVRILLAPRGEFDEGALALRPRKKRIYLRVYKLLRLHKLVTWHASAEPEAQAIHRLWGGGAKVLVREDETSLPLQASDPSVHFGRLKAVFLGRISRKKGLLVVLQALEETNAELEIDIYGPDEDQVYVRECQQAARRLPPNVVVRFRGPIQAEMVRDSLQEYDVMLMPTFGENFGHVIAEALSVSCPVMCSSTTPWTQHLRAGGGVVVDEGTNPRQWRKAIENYAALAPGERKALRLAAGAIYNTWRSSPKGPHVFSLFLG